VELRISFRDQSLVESCRAEWVGRLVKSFGVKDLARLLSAGALYMMVVYCDAGNVAHISRDHTRLACYRSLKESLSVIDFSHR